MSYKKYTIVSQICTQTKNIKLNNTNTIEFINQGTVSATVNNNLPLPVGAILTFAGNENEVLDENFNITVSFANITGAKVLVVQKNYL